MRRRGPTPGDPRPRESGPTGTAMTSSQLFETISDQVCRMDRTALIERLLHLDRIRLDFTPEYLSTVSTERIRHMLAAALWRCDTRDQTH